jgi:hypothetical protein
MAKKSADARKNSSFGSVGGSGGDPCGGGGGSAGTSAGGKTYHAAPKSKENINPPCPTGSFSGVGGKSNSRV